MGDSLQGSIHGSGHELSGRVFGNSFDNISVKTELGSISELVMRLYRSQLLRGFLLGFLLVLFGWRALAEESKLLNISDGRMAGQARIQLVQNAKKSITAQYFIYADDRTSYVALALLREAARRGVQVRLIVDAMFNGIPKAIREYLVAEGVDIRVYHPVSILKPGRSLRRMHDKVLLVDGQYMITGGRNIQNDYFHLPGLYDYADRDSYVEGGHAVAVAAQYFEDLWKSAEVSPLRNGVYSQAFREGDCQKLRLSSREQDRCRRQQRKVQELYVEQIATLDKSLDFLNGKSGFRSASNLDLSGMAKVVPGLRFIHDPVGAKDEEIGTGEAIVDLFDSAKSEIVIESPYASPHELAFEALTRARARGVRVRILTNSSYSGDNTPALVGYYKEDRKALLKLGIELFEYKGPQSLHAKTIVVDRRRAYVGSYNLDRLSHQFNTETGVVFEDAEVSESLIAEIEEAMQSSFIIDAEGVPTNLGPHQSYPWKKGKRGLKTLILEVLLPLYRRMI